MLPDPLLTDLLRDWIAIVSAVATLIGFLLTVLSLFYAIGQIRRTQTAARAAEEAARQVLSESRSRFADYSFANLMRYVDQAEDFVSRRDWALATLRVNDLALQAAQLGDTDREWQEIAAELIQSASTFRRIANGELKDTPQQRKRWSDFLLKLKAKVIEQHGPFKTNRGGESP